MQKQKQQKAANSWRIWLRKKWSNLPTGWVMEISNRVGGARAPHGVYFVNPSPSLTSLLLRPIGPIIRRRPRLLPMLHANYILCTDWKVTMIWLHISCKINLVASMVESKVRHIRELTTVITRDSYEKYAIACYLYYMYNMITERQCTCTYHCRIMQCMKLERGKQRKYSHFPFLINILLGCTCV